MLARFGPAVWNEVFEEFKTTINNLGLFPETRIVYEYDDTEVLAHMFIHTMRDFRTHLLKRLFNG